VQVDFDIDGTHIVDGVAADAHGVSEKGTGVDVGVRKMEGETSS
jgi:hypothetical protein